MHIYRKHQLSRKPMFWSFVHIFVSFKLLVDTAIDKMYNNNNNNNNNNNLRKGNFDLG